MSYPLTFKDQTTKDQRFSMRFHYTLILRDIKLSKFQFLNFSHTKRSLFYWSATLRPCVIPIHVVPLISMQNADLLLSRAVFMWIWQHSKDRPCPLEKCLYSFSETFMVSKITFKSSRYGQN